MNGHVRGGHNRKKTTPVKKTAGKKMPRVAPAETCFDFEIGEMKVRGAGAVQVTVLVPYEHSEAVLGLRTAAGVMLSAVVKRRGRE